MSEERKKILEMLSDGKITVDDAERLLTAIGDGDRDTRPVDDAPQDKDPVIDLNNLEQQIRAGFEGARRTVRASMPHLRTAIRNASPDVERIVEEATASIPGFIEEMTTTLRDTFGQSEHRGDDRYPAEVELDFTEESPIQPESRLALHNPRGTIEVIAWDEDRMQADVHVTVRSHDEETARAAAESVQLVQEPGDGRLVLRPVFPRGREDASYRLDIRLHVPRRLLLDLHTTHGDLVIPEMESDIVLGGDHGQIRLAGTTGSASVQHNHGSVQVGRVGGKFALNANHSHLDLDESVLDTSINAHHGRLRLRRIGGDLALNAHHSPFDADEVHGNAVANSHHGPLNLRQVIGDLTVNSKHCPVNVQQVGGSLRLASDHGPVEVQKVSGELSAQCGHGPLSIGPVGRSAVVRSSHSPVDIGPVGEEVTVEADRGPVHIRGAGGRVTVRASRGDVRIDNPAKEVMVENSRAAIDVFPEGPVRSAYTLSNDRGNVTVILPDGSDVSVEGFVRRGVVETSLPLAVSANGEQGQSVSGNLGTGEAPVRVEMSRATLTLRRE